MLHEDIYTPFPYFYDVTAWSQPLLFNVRGGYSSERLRPHARRAGLLADPGSARLAGRVPRVALWQLSAESTSAIESGGWLRYLLERVWRLPYDDVTTADVKAGALDEYDAVIVPNCERAGPRELPGGRRGRRRRGTRTGRRGGRSALGERRRPLDQLARGHEARRAGSASATVSLTEPDLGRARQPVPRASGRRHATAARRRARGLRLLRVRLGDAGLVARVRSPSGSRPPTAGDWFISGFAAGRRGAGRHGRRGRRARRRRPGDRLLGRAQLPRLHHGVPEDPAQRAAQRRARGAARAARDRHRASRARQGAARGPGRLQTIRLAVRPASARPSRGGAATASARATGAAQPRRGSPS